MATDSATAQGNGTDLQSDVNNDNQTAQKNDSWSNFSSGNNISGAYTTSNSGSDSATGTNWATDTLLNTMTAAALDLLDNVTKNTQTDRSSDSQSRTTSGNWRTGNYSITSLNSLTATDGATGTVTSSDEELVGTVERATTGATDSSSDALTQSDSSTGTITGNSLTGSYSQTSWSTDSHQDLLNYLKNDLSTAFAAKTDSLTANDTGTQSQNDSGTDTSSETGNDLTGSYVQSGTDLTTTVDPQSGTDARGAYSGTITSTSTQTSSGSGNSDTGSSGDTTTASSKQTVLQTGGNGTSTYTNSTVSSNSSTDTGSANGVSGSDSNTDTNTASQTVSETGSAPGASYTLTSTNGGTTTDTQTNDPITGKMTDAQTGTSTGSLHETGGSDASDWYTLDKTTTGSTGTTRIDDPGSGLYSVSGSVGTSSTAKETNAHGTGSATFTETLTDNGTISGTGSADAGYYTLTQTGTRTASFTDQGSDTTGTFTVNEGSNGGYTDVTTGYAGVSQNTVTETAPVTYRATESLSGSTPFTLISSGVDTSTSTTVANGVTGASSMTGTGQDVYTLSETGTATGGMFSEGVTGTDNYTSNDASNSAAQTDTGTTSGGGTWTRTSSGAGATLANGSGTNNYTQTTSGNAAAGVFSQSETGSDRYKLVQVFDDVSNANGGATPGNVTFHTHGLMFRDPDPSSDDIYDAWKNTWAKVVEIADKAGLYGDARRAFLETQKARILKLQEKYCTPEIMTAIANEQNKAARQEEAIREAISAQHERDSAKGEVVNFFKSNILEKLKKFNQSRIPTNAVEDLKQPPENKKYQSGNYLYVGEALPGGGEIGFVLKYVPERKDDQSNIGMLATHRSIPAHYELVAVISNPTSPMDGQSIIERFDKGNAASEKADFWNDVYQFGGVANQLIIDLAPGLNTLDKFLDGKSTTLDICVAILTDGSAVLMIGGLLKAGKISGAAVKIGAALQVGSGTLRVGQGVAGFAEGSKLEGGLHIGEGLLRLIGAAGAIKQYRRIVAKYLEKEQIAAEKLAKVENLCGKGVAEAVKAGGYCFVAGTPLLVPNGHKPIEEFLAGDQILSRSESDPYGATDVQIVEEVFTRNGTTLQVTVSGRLIETTREHPIFVIGKGWRTAGELQYGDQLSSHNGVIGVVESIVECSELKTLYNLRVSKFHTYFVGCDEWGFSVWAHNTCGTITFENGQYVLRDASGKIRAQNASQTRITKIADELGVSYQKTPNGNPLLAEVELGTPGDMAIVGAKPRQADKLGIKKKYENQGDHDPTSPKYNKTKGVLPDEHAELFKKSFLDPSGDPGTLYAFELGKDGRIVAIHRFQGTNGGFHWNGATNGVDGFGQARPLGGVPAELLRKIGTKP